MIKIPENGLAGLFSELDKTARGEGLPIATPWTRLNRELGGGLAPGEITTIAGGVGASKSFFVQNICQNALMSGKPFRFLPLEDSHKNALCRAWAILRNDWTILERDSKTAVDLKGRYSKDAPALTPISQSIAENPRLPIIGYDGKPFCPPLPTSIVTEWLPETIKEKDHNQPAMLLCIDPITQIDFADPSSGVAQWEGEQKFVRSIIALACSLNVHVLLVAHLAKRNGSLPLGPDAVQGSAAFSRFAHNVILIESHEPKESRVYRASGMNESITANRTLHILKTRNGPGSGKKMAYFFGRNGPTFEELGIIIPGNRYGN